MASGAAGLVALVLAAGVQVAARVPAAEPGWAVASVAAGVVTCVAAATRLMAPSVRGAGASAFLAALGHLVLPASTAAPLAAVPDPVVALAVVAALHAFFSDSRTRAPVVASGRSHPAPAGLLRAFPFAVVAVLLVALPLAAPFVVPDRIAAAYELHRAVVPLAALAFVAALLVLVGGLRQWASSARSGGSPQGVAASPARSGVEAS